MNYDVLYSIDFTVQTKNQIKNSKATANESQSVRGIRYILYIYNVALDAWLVSNIDFGLMAIYYGLKCLENC